MVFVIKMVKNELPTNQKAMGKKKGSGNRKKKKKKGPENQKSLRLQFTPNLSLNLDLCIKMCQVSA